MQTTYIPSSLYSPTANKHQTSINTNNNNNTTIRMNYIDFRWLPFWPKSLPCWCVLCWVYVCACMCEQTCHRTRHSLSARLEHTNVREATDDMRGAAKRARTLQQTLRNVRHLLGSAGTRSARGGDGKAEIGQFALWRQQRMLELSSGASPLPEKKQIQCIDRFRGDALSGGKDNH